MQRAGLSAARLLVLRVFGLKSSAKPCLRALRSTPAPRGGRRCRLRGPRAQAASSPEAEILCCFIFVLIK